MGLGRLALENILLALASCKHARPVALVSGSPDKMRAIAVQYGIGPEHCYSYHDFDRIRDDKIVDAAYIVLPNGLHRDATVRAARAGKHVLCEKRRPRDIIEARSVPNAELEVDHLAECVRDDVHPRTPGEEGLADQVVMAAIYEAARTGRTVKLKQVNRVDTYRGAEPAPAT